MPDRPPASVRARRDGEDHPRLRCWPYHCVSSVHEAFCGGSNRNSAPCDCRRASVGHVAGYAWRQGRCRWVRTAGARVSGLWIARLCLPGHREPFGVVPQGELPVLRHHLGRESLGSLNSPGVGGPLMAADRPTLRASLSALPLANSTVPPDVYPRPPRSDTASANTASANSAW